MSACMVRLERPDDLENRARVAMSACMVRLERSDDLETGARVEMRPDVGVVR